MKSLKYIIALLGLGVLAGSAQAQKLTGALKKIKDTGTITLGVRDSSIPFSYLDEKQSYQGYSIDLCLKAATAIQKQLGLTALEVKMVSVTPTTTIPLITNGAIDLSCGAATNDAERQKVISFAPTTYVTANRIMTKKSSGIKVLNDLKGKIIVSTSGSTNLKQITSLNAERNLDMKILAARDHAEAFLMLETGRASAFVMDDVLLASFAATSKAPGDFVITGESLSVAPYGIMEPKNDPAFKAAVDQAFIAMMKNGELARLYAKWFQSPIPPKGVNLNIPMSAELLAVIKSPTDSGDPGAYAVVPAAQAKMK